MKPGLAVQTLLSSRAAKAALALLASLGVAAPAAAATVSSVLDDARDIAVETGAWIETAARSVWAGDMDAIRDSAFALAGILALLGLWLLIRPPWRTAGGPVIALPDGQGFVEPTLPVPEAAESPEHDPPAVRLLEAVAAAKEQFSISEAERKRSA